MEVGGDTFSVGSSTGKVEEDIYEDYVTRFLVHEDYIEIGVLLEADGFSSVNKLEAKQGEDPDRTFRIETSSITDVRREKVERYPGIAFETADDLYKLKLATTEGGFASSSKDFDTATLEEAIEKIKENMTEEFGKIEDSSSNSGSLVEELERLADLHESGALSDKEFQQAKDDLLE